jgi:hypothetical protein
MLETCDDNIQETDRSSQLAGWPLGGIEDRQQGIYYCDGSINGGISGTVQYGSIIPYDASISKVGSLKEG